VLLPKRNRRVMIKDKGIHMRRVIVGLIITALGIAILSAPATATCPDPHKQLPWMDPSVTPEGDDSGWHDVDSSDNDQIIVFIDLFNQRTSRYLIVYLIPTKINSSGSIERDASSNNTNIPAGRDSSTR
jgi:hypothetical protein